jgi:hypothetical protein
MHRSTRPLPAYRSTRQLPAFWSTRPIPAFVAPVLVAVAVLGFLAGHHRAAPAPEEPARVSYGAGIALEYPSTWQRTAAAATVPGLEIVHPLLLAPGGDSRRAGLLSGQIAPGEATPLPAGLVSLMRGLPRTEVVDFLDVQAYRYSHVRLTGYDRTLDLYVIPNPAGAPTALACYASRQYASYLAQCEQIVARLTPIGRSRYDLKPDAAYSARLGALLGALDGERLVLRRQMGVKQRPAAVAGLARTLADRLTTAAASIRTLRPPRAARPAQASLIGSIERAGETYRALATAVAAVGPGGAVATQQQVDGAEAGVDLSLESFALLGYKHS